jgi:hypothetical protein
VGEYQTIPRKLKAENVRKSYCRYKQRSLIRTVRQKTNTEDLMWKNEVKNTEVSGIPDYCFVEAG